MNRKILAIVEGEKKEPQLLNRLFDTYMYKKRQIVSYGANIYDLYERIQRYYGENLEDLDFLLFLREQEPDENKKLIFDDRYTDVYLIFDFDPQDNRFSVKALQQMMHYFNDSTSRGRLYINYPMVESCIHIPSFENSNYLYSRVCLTELGQYKTRANTESCCPDITRYDKRIFSQIIRLNLDKIRKLTCCNEKMMVENLYAVLREVLKIQIHLLQQTASFYILNTCLLCVYEYNPKMIEWLERK
nr:hypothetical protein [uncultured Lachnoclostridium sp.]